MTYLEATQRNHLDSEVSHPKNSNQPKSQLNHSLMLKAIKQFLKIKQESQVLDSHSTIKEFFLDKMLWIYSKKVRKLEKI